MSNLKSIHEEFNARNLTPEQVAATFVAPPDFGDLWQSSDVVLMGPRGSGKTTLLKMLTLPALMAWENDHAKYILENIEYYAVYIPTGVHWNEELHNLLLGTEKPRLIRKCLVEAAVTTNILNSMCNCFEGLSELKYGRNKKMEATLCGTLIKEWRLDSSETVPSLKTIQLALKSRINSIFEIAKSQITKIENLTSGLNLDYNSAIIVACQAFDNIYDNKHKWALCFDDLERAPDWLKRRLFTALRTPPEGLIFKLSIGPLPSLEISKVTQGKPKHDFTPIRLWAHKNRDPYAFCKQLVESIIKRELGSKVNAEHLFGTSPTARKDRYSEGSRIWNTMVQLAEKDRSFRELLTKNNLSPTNPTTNDSKIRDKLLRKAKPIAYLRNAYLKSGPLGKLVKRSRKRDTIFYGKEVLFEISDGNPRWLKAITKELLTAVKKDSMGHPKRIPKEKQIAILEKISSEFEAYIKALPHGYTKLRTVNYSIHDFIEEVGNYFSSGLLSKKFPLDPAGSFKVDSKIASDLSDIIGIAIDQGAIILLDPIKDAFDSNLIGRRFRIAYLLYPIYKIPLRLYRAVSLSKCLAKSVRAAEMTDKTQELLFDAEPD